MMREWTAREYLRHDIRFAVSTSLTTVRGLRQQIGDAERDRIADHILAHIERSNWRFERGPALQGHGGPAPEPAENPRVKPGR